MSCLPPLHSPFIWLYSWTLYFGLCFPVPYPCSPDLPMLTVCPPRHSVPKPVSLIPACQIILGCPPAGQSWPQKTLLEASQRGILIPQNHLDFSPLSWVRCCIAQECPFLIQQILCSYENAQNPQIHKLSFQCVYPMDPTLISEDKRKIGA